MFWSWMQIYYRKLDAEEVDWVITDIGKHYSFSKLLRWDIFRLRTKSQRICDANFKLSGRLSGFP